MITREINKSVLKPGKILAVASDPDIIRIFGVNLTHANFEFISADNGTEAMDRTISESPDVIVLNPPLPDIDVNSVYLRLQRSSQTRNIPVIIIVAAKSERIIDQTDGGIIHYITKPFDPNDLVSLVQVCIKQRKGIQPLATSTDRTGTK